MGRELTLLHAEVKEVSGALTLVRLGRKSMLARAMRQHSAVKIIEVSLFLRGHSVRRFLCFVYMECTFPKVHTYADLKYKR